MINQEIDYSLDLETLLSSDSINWLDVENIFKENYLSFEKLLFRLHFKRKYKLEKFQKDNILKFLSMGYMISDDVRYFNEFLWFYNNDKKYLQEFKQVYEKFNENTKNRFHKFPLCGKQDVKDFIEQNNFVHKLEMNSSKKNWKIGFIGVPFFFKNVYWKLNKNFNVEVVSLKHDVSRKKRFLLRSGLPFRLFNLLKGVTFPYKVLNCNYKDEELTDVLKARNFDIGFHKLGFILKENIINGFKFGILNDHWGILPFIRGKSTIEYSLLFDFPVGVTVHYIDKTVDTGDIVKIYLYEDLISGYRSIKKIKNEIKSKLGDRIFDSICTVACQNENISLIKNDKSQGLTFYSIHPFLSDYIEKNILHKKEKFRIKSISQLKYYFRTLVRKGLTFNKILKELQYSQYFTVGQLEELQNQKLRKIIEHCYKNVPYYKELFDKLKLKPKDIKTKEDLNKLPFLDKHIVRENFDKLIAKNTVKALCNIGYTSGTTGTPGRFLRDYYSINFENAILYRFWSNIVGQNFKIVTLRAHTIIPTNQEKPPFWECNKADRELIMSSYHLLEKNAQIYTDKILEFNPDVIFALPSSVCTLARFFEGVRHNLKIKAIFTSSENLSLSQRIFIENVFNCKIYDEYGLVERVAAIHQCEKETYHVQEDYSVVELLPADDDKFEICGTHLYNYAMPLLRYKTGDLVELQEKQCVCGRAFREVKTIFGRSTEYILTPNGNKIVNFEVVTSNVFNVIETQYEQNTPSKIIIRILATDDFNEKDKKNIIDNFKNYVSDSMDISVEKVSNIPRSANGKFKKVIKKFKTDDDILWRSDYE